MELAFHKHAMLYHFLDWGFWATDSFRNLRRRTKNPLGSYGILQTHTDVELESLEKAQLVKQSQAAWKHAGESSCCRLANPRTATFSRARLHSHKNSPRGVERALTSA